MDLEEKKGRWTAKDNDQNAGQFHVSKQPCLYREYIAPRITNGSVGT